MPHLSFTQEHAGAGTPLIHNATPRLVIYHHALLELAPRLYTVRGMRGTPMKIREEFFKMSMNSLKVTRY